jgi:N-methylhydantoinase B
MLAQAVTGTPGHVNAMAAAVGKFLRVHPLATLSDGDVLVTNDPWDGTGHLNDFTVVTPVFRGGQCRALFASTSHIADVGGRGFGPDANDLYEEGLRIPICPLFRAGERDETLMRLIKANVRDPVTAEGDLHSLTACNELGGRALNEMLDDFGLDDLDAVAEFIISTSRTAMASEIAALPDGSFSHEMTIDGYREPVLLKALLTIDGERLSVDFTGSSPRSDVGINVPLPYTEAYASFGVRCIVGNQVPNNAGSLAAVSVTAPAGSILNAPRPSAVSARHSVGQMLPDVVLGCLAQVVPDQVPAEGASCIWNPVFLNAPASGSANADATPFVSNPIFNGGTGARSAKDGLSTTAFPSGVRTTSTEINEATTPLVIWRKEYRQDSGGVGERRGGLGQTIEIGHRQGAAFVISKMFDRIGHPARGRQGGGAGLAGSVRLSDGQALPGKGRDLVPAGANLILETPGGGGMGQATVRSRQAVAEDLAAGLISPAAASADYGYQPAAPESDAD